MSVDTAPELQTFDEAVELRRWPDLEYLYRPLDQQDRRWMEPLGCQWPDEASEDQWLEDINTLIDIGRQKQPRHPDEYSDVVYKARTQFLEHLPIARRAEERFEERFSELSSRHRHPMPVDGMVGSLRLVHHLGFDVANKLMLTLSTRPERLIERFDNLYHNGLDGMRVLELTDAGVLTASPETTNRKLRIIYSLARTMKIEDYRGESNRAIEEWPTILAYSGHRLRTLRLISATLFRSSTISWEDIRRVAMPSLEATVAAYLDRGEELDTAIRLHTHSRRLGRGFTTEELRGFILQHPDDPVVKKYLKARPVKEDEWLPTIHKLSFRTDEERTTPYGANAFRIATRASSRRQVERSLRRVEELDLDAKDPETRRRKAIQFSAIDRGRRAEPVLAGLLAQGDADPERIENLRDIVEMGRNVRKMIVMGYAVRAIAELIPAVDDITEAPSWPGDDAVQTQLLKLLVATIDFARRPEERRRDMHFWQYAKDRMRRIKLHELEELEV